MSEPFIRINSNPTGVGPTLFNTVSSISSTFLTTNNIELSSFTFTTWFCPSSSCTNGKFHTILSLDKYSIQVIFYPSSGGTGYVGLRNTRYTSAVDLARTWCWELKDCWHHIAITHDGNTNGVQFYFDGVLRDEVYYPYININTSRIDLITSVSSTNNIGLFKAFGDDSGSLPFIGGLADMRLYFRILSSNEIPYNPIEYPDAYKVGYMDTDPYNLGVVQIRKDGTIWGRGDIVYYKCGEYCRGYIKLSNDTDWKTIASKNRFALGIKNDGTLWAYGNNYYGKLGLGDDIDRNEFVQVGTDNDWKLVACSFYTSYAIKTDGTIYMCGYIGYDSGFSYEQYQQYYDNDISELHTFTKISDLSGFTKISARGYGAYVMKDDGTLWSWGQSYMGSGLGTVSATDPVSYHGLTQIGTDTNWKDVFGGAFYGFAVKTDGTLWGTGQDSGQGGWGHIRDYGSGPSYSSSTIYTFVQLGTATDWDTVGCGEYHTIGLKTGGDLYIWGSDVRLMEDTLSGIDANNWGHRYDLSYSVDVSGRFTPTKCVGNYMGSKIYLSYSHPVPKFILKSDGMLYESGYNGSSSTLYRLHPSIPLGLEL